MTALKKSPTVSAKASSKVVAKPTKPAAPVTAKRVTPKALPKKPVAAPAKPVTRTAAPKTTTKVIVAKEVKAEKVKKPKLIRDSFTIPKAEYVVVEALKERAGKLARSVKKSELLRAGIKALAAMSDANFLSALSAVPTIKTGRPSTAV